jgi:hypothetical protein
MTDPPPPGSSLVFDLASDQVTVTYTPQPPVFHYHDASQDTTFSGDDVETQDSDLATLVSVGPIIAGWPATFTVLIPSIMFTDSSEAPIKTYGIYMWNKWNEGQPPPPDGPQQDFDVAALSGTVRLAQ